MRTWKWWWGVGVLVASALSLGAWWDSPTLAEQLASRGRRSRSTTTTDSRPSRTLAVRPASRDDGDPEVPAVAVKVNGENDRLAFVGLVTELQGRANGLCGGSPDRQTVMNVGLVGGEIKVPKGSDALRWFHGGALSIAGTALGYHGGGPPDARIGVRVAPTKPLWFGDNFYRMSLLDVQITGDVR